MSGGESEALPAAPAGAVPERLGQLLPELAGPIAKAARHVLAYPEDVAVFSMRELARRIAVPPATLVRLAQRLGFPGYNALRRRYVEGVRQGTAGSGVAGIAAARNRDSARALAQAAQSGSLADFAAGFFAAEQEVLRQTLAGLSMPALEAAAQLLAGARRVQVLGRRTAFVTAFALAYTLQKVRPDVALLNDLAGAPEAMLEDAGPGDVLVVVTSAPFSRMALSLAEQAAAAGARIIAIAEAPIPPLRRLCGPLVFLGCTRGGAFPESVGGSLAIAHLLAALVIARLGEPAQKRIAANEKRIVMRQEYLMAGPPRGRPRE
ncbi:MurR/RpiR family transcriptional regulator [Teichococcus rhizosphaerae]|nr:MurR/RpiR family transcriptional regulator [Pseudoroseomonas rhizosphaerae]